MLRIIASQSTAQAKSYYTNADYYTEGQELTGAWCGEGARRLGLEGSVQPEVWEALCENRDPFTGDRLTLRTRQDRRVGYDFNFHVPKSVSLLYALTDDDRLLDAFRDSVRETMAEMEGEMQTRLRKGGKNEDRTTGNMLWGEFLHKTSRPVDGVPDPHLHAHCFVFNQTWDSAEECWKAGQFGSLKRDAPYFEARFHVRLAEKLGDLGLPVKRTKTGWEIEGISAETVRKFSRRTQEIEEEASRRGITDPEAKSELGAKTRCRKQKQLSMPELRQEWHSRLTEEEQQAIASVTSRIGQERPAREAPNAVREAIDLASDHCFERRSVLPERTLLAESLKRAVGQASIQEVEQALAAEPFLVRERQGRRMVTIPEVLAEEQRMLVFAREGRGTCPALAPGRHAFQRTWLNDGQRKAVEHVLHSHDRVILIRGAAGTGKTSMMQEAIKAIEAGGTQVFTFAPSAKASRDVLRSKGFHEAETVARLLVDEDLQSSIQGQVIWIDEAGLLGTRTMGQVFALAERLEARVILSGDRRQHGSVERGAALRLLEEEAGIFPAEIKEIQRQSRRYKQAVRSLSEGEITAGFQTLDELGWIREAPEAERYQLLAQDYLETITAGETALVVSPTHLEAERITGEIRSRLKASGRLSEEEHRLDILRPANLTEGERRDPASYLAGDVLVFHQNARGYTKGDRVVVGNEPPPVEQAARFQVFHRDVLEIALGDVLRITHNGKTADGRGRLHNGDLVHAAGFDERGNLLTEEGKTIGAGFGHLAYGYVSTSHGSQGTDVDRVFVGQSADSWPASSQEQFYVSVSRGRKQAVIYTDSKGDLLEAVKRSDERLSATELLSAEMVAERGGWNRDADDRYHSHHHVKELAHER